MQVTQAKEQAALDGEEAADNAAEVVQFAQLSTFSTPPGITADNINSKVVCPAAAAAGPGAETALVGDMAAG